MAASDWTENDWTPVSSGDYQIGTLAWSWFDCRLDGTNYVPTGSYGARESGVHGRVTCSVGFFGGGTTGALKVFASATNYVGGIGASPPPFAADGAYHLLGSQSGGSGTVYQSSLLADTEPGFAQHCSQGSIANGIEVDAEGWYLLGAVGVFKAEFNPNPDNIHCADGGGGDGGCASCGGGGIFPGSVNARSGSLDVSISLGRTPTAGPPDTFTFTPSSPARRCSRPQACSTACPVKSGLSPPPAAASARPT